MKKELSKIEKGLISEDKASIWLIQNGYYVFMRKTKLCIFSVTGHSKMIVNRLWTVQIQEF